MRCSVAVAMSIFAGGSCGAAGSCQNEIVPATTYPTSAGAVAPWTTLYGKTGVSYNSPLTSGLDRYIIMSPPYTPGATRDSNWVAVIDHAHDANYSPPGTKAIVYVDLNFGANSEATVEAAIDSLVANYFGSQDSQLYFDGIFFDRVPGDSGHLAYMTDILNYASASSRFGRGDFWMNFGFWPVESYMNLVPGVFTGAVIENTYAAWSAVDVPNVPAWVAKYQPFRFASIVHDVLSSDMITGTSTANRINIGTVFFTDGTGENPYANLPSYWSFELTQVNGGC
jgi:Spherulation-specific family 4